MTFYVENEVEAVFDFDIEELLKRLIRAAVAYEKCPYEVEVAVTITDAAGIREYNKEYRKIDSATDVLSFPAVDYEKPSDFSLVADSPACYLNPDTQELVLGDIILCEQRIREQAKEYGHSLMREFSFLVIHSMLHLFGYDHMEPQEEREMFDRQEAILQGLGICR